MVAGGEPQGAEADEVGAPPRGEDRRRTREQARRYLAALGFDERQGVTCGLLGQLADPNVLVGWVLSVGHKLILYRNDFEKQTRFPRSSCLRGDGTHLQAKKRHFREIGRQDVGKSGVLSRPLQQLFQSGLRNEDAPPDADAGDVAVGDGLVGEGS
jgi:hypothetical protein